jgi:hypothetical protein
VPYYTQEAIDELIATAIELRDAAKVKGGIKIMNSFRKICLAFSAILLGLTLVACEKEEGPAEKMGKTVDKATEQAGQAMEKAKDNVTEAAKDAASQAKKAAE